MVFGFIDGYVLGDLTEDYIYDSTVLENTG